MTKVYDKNGTELNVGDRVQWVSESRFSDTGNITELVSEYVLEVLWDSDERIKTCCAKNCTKIVSTQPKQSAPEEFTPEDQELLKKLLAKQETYKAKQETYNKAKSESERKYVSLLRTIKIKVVHGHLDEFIGGNVDEICDTLHAYKKYHD